MNSNEKFHTDRLRGDKGEDIATSVLEENGFTVVKNTSANLAAYDLFITGHGIAATAEVKFDEACFRYGNVALEKGRVPYGAPQDEEHMVPTALMATTADMVIYVVKKKSGDFAVHLGLTLEYQNLISQSRDIRWGGDGKRTRMAIVKYEDFAAAIPAL